MPNKKLNKQLNKKLNKQIDLITNTEFLNRQYSIEYLLQQLKDLYNLELKEQERLNKLF